LGADRSLGKTSIEELEREIIEELNFEDECSEDSTDVSETLNDSD
jgi:hypothetical protein